MFNMTVWWLPIACQGSRFISTVLLECLLECLSYLASTLQAAWLFISGKSTRAFNLTSIRHTFPPLLGPPVPYGGCLGWCLIHWKCARIALCELHLESIESGIIHDSSPFDFLICIDVKVRSRLQMEIAQSDPCTFSLDKMPPESLTAQHRRTQQMRKRTSNRCEIEGTCTFSWNEQPNSLESARQVA